MALVCKAAELSDLNKRKGRMSEHLLGALAPSPHKPLMRSNSCRAFEGVGKVTHGKTAYAGEIGDGYVAIKASFDQILRHVNQICSSADLPSGMRGHGAGYDAALQKKPWKNTPPGL